MICILIRSVCSALRQDRPADWEIYQELERENRLRTGTVSTCSVFRILFDAGSFVVGIRKTKELRLIFDFAGKRLSQHVDASVRESSWRRAIVRKQTTGTIQLGSDLLCCCHGHVTFGLRRSCRQPLG